MEEEQEQIQQASLLQLMNWWKGDVPNRVKSRIRFRIAVGKVLCTTSEGAAFLKDQALSADFAERINAILDLNRAGLVDQEIMDSLLAAFEATDPILKCYALFCLCGIKRYVLSRDAAEPLFYQLELLQGELATQAMEYLTQAFPESSTEILRIGLQSDLEGMRMGACHAVLNNELYELLDEVEKLEKDANQFVANSARNTAYMLRSFRSSSRE